MKSERNIYLDDAMRDPSKVFDEPMDVIKVDHLSPTQKREILRQWELDARELLVAEEENMAGGEPAMLGRVHEALRQINVHTANTQRTDVKLG